MQVPDNSNIALIVNMITKAPDKEAMEFWVMAGLINYAEECSSLNPDDYSAEQQDMVNNMKALGEHALKIISMKHKEK